jgi:hypothetical protein
MAWCYHESQEVEEGHGSRALCKGCYDTIAPKDGTPNRKAMRASAKEAITQQGPRMRKYAQDRAQGEKTPPPPAVGTLVRVKVDKVDCLMAQRFQVEPIKKPENYDLQNALENWQGAKKISVREALRAISMMGGQGFFFCNCKGNCKKNGCKCRKNGRQCNSKCHPCSTACKNHS